VRRKVMPKDFLNCVNSGGRVVTQRLKGNRYRQVCYDKKGRHEGEVKTKKKEKSNKNTKQIKKSRLLVTDLRRLNEHFDETRN